jgi:putative ABC transport system permease protein
MAARNQLRRRWGATLILIVLVGLAGGLIIAAVAGASRTQTAMKRFVAYSRPEDLVTIVTGARGDPSDPAVIAEGLRTRARFQALPQIAEVGRAPYIFVALDRQGLEVGSVNPFGPADAHAYRTFDRPLLLHGRFASLDRPDEAVIDDLTAAQRHLRVGSRLQLWAFTAEQMNTSASGGFGKLPAPGGPSYTFNVVGVMRLPMSVSAPPSSVIRDAIYQGQGSTILTPAFLHQFAKDQGVMEEALPGMEIFRVRLRRGLADLPAFQRAVSGVVSPGDGLIHVGSDIQTAAVKARGAIHLEAVALLLFAGLAGLAALLVLGQVLSRLVGADTADHPILAALGLSRRQLVLVPMARALIVGLSGAVAAVAVALALSPLTPIGLARRAEIHPGLSVNLAALGIGFVAVVGVVLLRALLPAWRAARVVADDALRQAPARPGPLSAAVAGLGLGPAAVAGVGMTFERGRGVAFRTALLGTLVAVAGVVASVTFGVSLRHLVHDPLQQGWNWDVLVGNPNSQSLAGDPRSESLHADMTRLLSNNRHVDAFSGLALSDGTADGRPIDLAGIESIRGSVFPLVVAGRVPRADDEIVLGRDALTQIHKRIGQTVTLRAGDNTAVMRIVGQALSPTAGDMSPRLSRGCGVTMAGLRRIQPGVAVLQFAVRYPPGVDRRAAFRSLLDDFGPEVLAPYPGGEVGNLAQVDFLPYVLAGLLVVLAIGALGVTLLGSVRRHRRDLALLKTIGFVRRQVSATVAWQATVLALGAVVVGVPCGVALGRWTWHLVAREVGSVAPPVVPVVGVLLVVPITLLAANVLAGAPAWSAGRIRPADVLHNE